jgi:cytochrome c
MYGNSTRDNAEVIAMEKKYLCAGLKYWAIPILLVFGHSALAENMRIPRHSPGLVVDVNKGKTLYGHHCASCHGPDLKGSKQGPPMLHRIYEPSHHGDMAFQFAVQNGSVAHHWPFGNMPPIPGLTPDDVAHITGYVREEQRKVGIQ